MLTLAELDKAPPGVLYLYVTQRTFGPNGATFRPSGGDLIQEQAACIVNRERGGWLFISKSGQQLVGDETVATGAFAQYVQHPANAHITLASRAADGTETVVDQSSTRSSFFRIGQPGVVASWAVLVAAIAMAVYFYRTRTVN
jgi:hypothetical protein